MVATVVDRADQAFIFRGEVFVQGSDGGEPPVDGFGLETPFALPDDKGIHVLERDLLERAIPDRFAEELEIAGVIFPGV